MQRLLPLLGTILLLSLACEDEVGSVCNPDRALMEETFEIIPGESRMQRAVVFENCSQLLCLSNEGSSPFCTIECESDAACPEDFICSSPILTGPFGCPGYEENGNTCVGTEPEDFFSYCTADPAVIADRQGISAE